MGGAGSGSAASCLLPSIMLYEQRDRICFWISWNNRAAQNFKLNGKCIRHSDVFVWNGVWVFAQLFSYPCNGLNPAAGFWRFFFIDSRNWSPSKVIISNHFSIRPNIEKIHILMTDDHINIRPKHPSGRISVSVHETIRLSATFEGICEI